MLRNGVVLIDGAAPNAKLRKATGLTSTLLVVTDGAPAIIREAWMPRARQRVARPPSRHDLPCGRLPPAAEVGAVGQPPRC